MESKHIAEHTQDVIDANRLVRAAADKLADKNLRNFIQLAATDEVTRACNGLRDTWGALYRLLTIAEHAPQEKEEDE